MKQGLIQIVPEHQATGEVVRIPDLPTTRGDDDEPSPRAVAFKEWQDAQDLQVRDAALRRRERRVAEHARFDRQIEELVRRIRANARARVDVKNRRGLARMAASVAIIALGFIN